MKWFKHDSAASMDAKVEQLLAKYGLEGYGLYFYCLELIARNVEKHNLTFELEHDANLIARRLYLSHELIQEMMAFMIKLGLFESHAGGVVTCLKMATRTDEYTQKLISQLGVVPTLSGDSHDTIGTKSVLIEEKRREEKRREKTEKPKVRNAIPPTVEMVADYCRERKNNINPEAFIDYYAAVEWMRGKNKIKDWQACVRRWEQNQRTDKSGMSLDLRGSL